MSDGAGARHERAKGLFLEALEVAPDEREALIGERCGDDAALRDEVLSLLAHHDPLTLIRERDAGERGVEGPRQIERPDPSLLDDGGPADTAPRFAVGAVVGGRYRIVARLGRGGMGEVYRAEDLRLGETVALKFLPQHVAEREKWLDRLRNEARLAREVTHPSVNRVHDLVEADDEVFLSMEFVDGEDLGSLLHRIGRLPADKALQIARELCAGLGAAHEKGVLHRDLKPSNVMLDGNGHVRITDFGIAASVTAAPGRVESAGTPAYMAPEVLAGQPATRASDLYSLGLVLYEILTGRAAFDRRAAPGIRRPTPTSPSRWLDDVDPRVERAILQCLEADPARRPATAHAVAAALPGGDPLALALALGELPSPEMVAAAGGHAALRPAWVIAALIGIATALAAVFALSGRTHLVALAGLDKPPEVLAERARELIARFGYEGRRPDAQWRFQVVGDTLEHLEREWRLRRSVTPRALPLVVFAYREGDPRLLPRVPIEDARVVEELPLGPGMVAVRLDARGRLLSLAGVPTRDEAAALHAAGGTPDWEVLFDAAGLRAKSFLPVEPPARAPPMYADTVRAWRAPAWREGLPPRLVEAAAVGARAVYFAVLEPWQQRGGREPEEADVYGAFGQRDSYVGSRLTRVLLLLLLLVGSVGFAWRHHRLGIGDGRGAGRLGWFVLAIGAAGWLFGQRHVSVFAEESSSAYVGLSLATFQAATAWIYYLALEPYVRRYWPQTMISWSRVLRGRVRDPLVGRDVILGTAFGLAITLVIQLASVAPSWAGFGAQHSVMRPGGFDLGGISGFDDLVLTLLDALLRAIPFGLSLLLMMLVLRAVLRRGWLLVPGFALVAGLVMSEMNAGDQRLSILVWFVLALGLGWMFVRIGLLAVIVSGVVAYLLLACPLTVDFDLWYSGTTWFALATLALLVGFAARTSRGGERLF